MFRRILASAAVVTVVIATPVGAQWELPGGCRA
jgi:hypothetical protein